MGSKEYTDYFKLAKTFPIREFIEMCGVDLNVKGNSCCPFHDDNPREPSFGIRDDQNFFQCFCSHCNKAGDIIRFAELFFNEKPLDAAKRVCESFGVNVTQEMTEEARANLERLKRDREIASAERDKKIKQKQASVRVKMQELSGGFVDALDLNDSAILEKVKKAFPFIENMKKYHGLLGYSKYDDDVVIINTDGQQVNNIKYKTKKNSAGKWVSTASCTQAPFPLTLFDPNKDDVWLCEGEKDALHLHEIGINALTLGGVMTRWENFKHLLQGKNVYIFYDHDNAGYKNTIERVIELRGVAKRIYVVLFFFLYGNTCPDKFDISDWFLRRGYLSNPSEAYYRFLIDVQYSTFVAVDEVLDKIADFIDMPEDKRLKYGIRRETTSDDIYNAWSANAISPRGEKGEETKLLIKSIVEQLKDNTEEYKKVEEILKTIKPDYMGSLKQVLELDAAVLRNYSKQGRGEVYKAFFEMCNQSGHPLYRDVKGFLAWSGEVFIKIEDDEFKHYAMDRWLEDAKVQYKSHHGDTIDYLVKDLRMKCENIATLKKKTKGRAYTLQNGTFLIKDDGGLRFYNAYDPKYCCTNRLPFSYDPSAECPKWKSMLNRVLPDKDEQKALQEFFGYCLSPNHNYETFLFLYGSEGGNGKSVVLNILSSFFGKANVSYLQMQNLKGHELHAIKGKILNIGAEVDAGSASDGAQNLKILTSTNDNITIDPKHQDAYTLEKVDQPKMAFSGNKKPTSGMDNGIFRRMLMLIFDVKIRDDEKIFDISERFIDEYSGIFNWALVGLKRLIANGGFTRSARMKSSIDEYKDEQNPMRIYVRECIKPAEDGDENASVKKSILYKNYENWAKSSGHQAMSRTKFFSAFKQVCDSYSIKVEDHRPKGGERELLGFYLQGTEVSSE